MAQFADDVNAEKTVLVEFTAEWFATGKLLKAQYLDRSKTTSLLSMINVVVIEFYIVRITDQARPFFTNMQPNGGFTIVAKF